MQCDRARELISPFLDGELVDTDAGQLTLHLASCGSCGALLADYRRMGAQLVTSGREAMPAALTARVRAALAADAIADDGHDVVATTAAEVTRPTWRSIVRRHGKHAAQFAAVSVLSVLATWSVMMERTGSAGLERDVLSAHVRALLQDTAVQVASSDQHTVKPWFTGRLEFAPEVRDLSADGFPLAGGRLDYIDGRRVGVLVYRRRLHVINVFTWPQAGVANSTPNLTVRNGYNLLQWTRRGMAYWAASDLNPDELRQLQGLL